MYFFDNQPSQAQDWAISHSANRVRGTKVAVIESDITYGKLLNLCDLESFRHMKWFKQEYEKKANARTTLATIIDIIADKTQAEVVRAMRLRKGPDALEFGFSADIELILAVRNIANILSKNLVWSGLVGYV